jgi:hypothetical protein
MYIFQSVLRVSNISLSVFNNNNYTYLYYYFTISFWFLQDIEQRTLQNMKASKKFQTPTSDSDC